MRNNLIIQLLGPNSGGSEPGIVAFDTESGERAWTVVSPNEFAPSADASAVDADYYVEEARYAAITETRGFVRVRVSSDVGERIVAVVAVSLTDGAILWRRSLNQDLVEDIVVANDTVILALADTEENLHTNAVQALDAATGREQWRVPTEHRPVQLTAVDGTIYAVLDTNTEQGPNRVLALR